MTLPRILAATAVAAGLALALPAEATLLTFEGFDYEEYNAAITRSGFTIGILPGDEQHFHEMDSSSYSAANNGTGVLLVDRPTRAYIEAADLSDFTLVSLDWAAHIIGFDGVITGYLDGSPVGSISASLSDLAYTTISGVSLGTIDRLVFNADFAATPFGYSFDNVLLNQPIPAPEPGTMALLGAGLLGLRALGRRRS